MILNAFSSEDGFDIKNIFGKQLIDESTSKHIKTIFEQFKEGSLSVDKLSQSTNVLDKALASYISTNQDATLTQEGFAKYTEASGTSLTALGKKAKWAQIKVAALNTVLNMGVALLVSWGISAIISIFDNIHTSAKELAEAAQNAKSNIDDMKSSMESLRTTTNDIKQRYAELAQGIEQVSGQNLTLSTDEYNEFLSLSNQLADLFPSLTKQYDENGNVILDLAGDTDTIVSSLNDLIQAEQAITNRQIADEIPDIYKQYKKDLDDYSEQLDIATVKRDKFQSILDNGYSVNTATKNPELRFEFDTELDLNTLAQVEQEIRQALSGAEIGINEYMTDHFLNFDGNTVLSFSNFSDESISKLNDMDDILSSYLKSIQDDITYYRGEIQSEISTFNQYIYTWLSGEWLYAQESDVGIQTAIQQLLFQSDWMSAMKKDGLDTTEWTSDTTNWLNKNYLQSIKNLPEEQKVQLSNLFNMDLSVEDMLLLAQQLEAYFKEHKIPISLDFITNPEIEGSEANTKNRLTQSITDISDNNTVSEEYARLQEYTKGFTDTQVNLWLETTRGITNAEEAIAKYEEAINSAKEEMSDSLLSDVHYSSIDNYYSKIDQIKSAYEDLDNVSAQTITELMQTFSNYDWQPFLKDQVELKDVLDELANDSLNDVISALSNVPDSSGLLEYLRETAHYTNEMQLLQESVSNTTDRLDELDAAIYAAQNSQSLSANEVRNLIALYPQLAAFVSETSDGYIIEANSLIVLRSQIYNTESASIDAQINQTKAAIKNTKLRIQAYKEEVNALQKVVMAAQIVDVDGKTLSGVSDEQDKINMLARAIGNSEDSLDGLYSKLGELKSVRKQLDLVEKPTSKSSGSGSGKDDTKSDEEKRKEAEEKRRAKIEALLSKQEYLLKIKEMEIEEAGTANEKKDLLKEEIAIKKKILRYNLDLAESEEERLFLQKEYDKYLDEVNLEKYENKRTERGYKIDNYSNKIQDIQNEIDLAEAKGGQGKQKQYEKMNEYLEKQKEFYLLMYNSAASRAKNAEYGSEEWAKYNDEMQEAEDNINQITLAQIENNRTILLLPVKQYEDLTEELERQLDVYTKLKSEIEAAINAASGLVQDQIDYYTELQETTSKSYDIQIEAIQKQRDAFTESNDALERQLALEKAQYELRKAQDQKNVKILRNGEFVYEADQDAIKEAQENLDKERYNQTVANFDEQIKSLEDAKTRAEEDFNAQIESLTRYKEKIDSIFESFEKILGLQQLTEQFGVDAISKVLSGDLSILDEMSGAYIDVAAKEQETEEKIQQYQDDIQAIQKIAEEWNGAESTITKAQKKIKAIVMDNADEIQAIEDRVETVQSIATEWATTKTDIEETLGLINDNHKLATETEAEILAERIESLKSFAEQAKEYLDSINDALNTAKEKQEELSKVEADNVKKEEKKNNKKDKKVVITTAGKSHSGMELGYIGDTPKTKDTFKLISLSQLSKDEIPRILQVGEAVLNAEQQKNILSNMNSAFIAGMMKVNVPQVPLVSPSIQKNIEFNGDIVINHPIGNVDDLAKKIKNEFLIKLDQQFYK